MSFFYYETISHPKNLKNILQKLHMWAISENISSHDYNKISLITEELFMNSYIHGYKKRNNGWISIHWEMHPIKKSISLIYKDKAPLFNPCTHSYSTVHCKKLPSRPIGGLGIHLVNSYANHLHYNNQGAHNTIIIDLIIEDAAQQ